MDLYYVDESYEPTEQSGRPIHFVLSAIRIREEDWSAHFERICAWRRELKDRLGIYTGNEFHATEFLAGKNQIAPARITTEQRTQLFGEALELLASLDEVHVINISLPATKKDRTANDLEVRAWDRMLNRINRTAKTLDGRLALLICDEGKEDRLTKLYRKLLRHNPIPSKYGRWPETGGKTKHTPLESIVEDPLFKSSKSSYFLQMADFVAYSLLRRDNPTPRTQESGVTDMFERLEPILYKPASGRDPLGVVRR